MNKYEMDEINNYPDQADHLKDYEWILFYCETDEHAEDIIQEIVTLLEPIYDIEESRNGIWVYSENAALFGIDSFNNVIILFSFTRDSGNFIHDTYMEDRRLIEITYIQNELFKVSHDELNVEFSTGFLEEGHEFSKFDDILPKTIGRLFLNRMEIGKAIVSYINWEMSEVNPTVDCIEIISTQRRKGYGTFFLKQIERYLERSNFDLVWISNVQDYDFFRKNGYEFDIDEGYKYLEYIYEE